MEKREIQLPDGNTAQVVLTPPQTSVSALVQTLDLPHTEAVILLAGGAALMRQEVEARLQALFTKGLASAASTLHALIIDGGTDSGVMALMGQAVAMQEQKPTLLGVSPAGKVSYPGKTGSEEETGSLDPHHSHFVLVETGEWGERRRSCMGWLKSFPEVALQSLCWSTAERLRKMRCCTMYASNVPSLSSRAAGGWQTKLPACGASRMLHLLTRC